MFISAKRNASVKAVTMTWTRYDASVMQKFMILADIAAPSAALSSVVVADNYTAQHNRLPVPTLQTQVSRTR